MCPAGQCRLIDLFILLCKFQLYFFKLFLHGVEYRVFKLHNRTLLGQWMLQCDC